jgi:uncharacterized membrane protein
MRAVSQSQERLLSPRRNFMSLGLGVAVGLVVGVAWTWRLMALITWTVAAVTVLAWVWARCWNLDDQATKRIAQDEGKARSTDTEVVLAAIASLAAVVIAMAQAAGRHDVISACSVLLCVANVALSWSLTNTVYAFKYARVYYFGEPDAEGIDFNQTQPPAYSDFAYMAFTVGMAYAVAETQPTSTYVRRLVLGHAVLSYLFGTGLLAIAVSLVTNLAG